MTWKIHPFRPQEPDDTVLTDHDTFLALIDATPSSSPSLLHFHVSLQGDMHTNPAKRTDKSYNFSDEAYDKVEDVVIKSIEGMLQRLKDLKIAVISLPSSCYGPRTQRAMDAGLEVFESRFHRGETFWRDMPEISTKGYWLRLGHRDMGGADYNVYACSLRGAEPPAPEPVNCLYGNSMSRW